MKRWLILLLLIIVSSMLISCSRVPTPTTNHSPLAYPVPSDSSKTYKTKIPKQSEPATKKSKTN